MKRRILIAFMFIAPFAANAQDQYTVSWNNFPREFLQVPATLLGMYLFVYFVITLIRTILDFRLRAKMIEKGVPDDVVKQFLQPTNRDAKTQVIKWALLLAGFGLGLVLVQLATPYGIHSIAIIVFCMALSLLGYYFFLKRNPE